MSYTSIITPTETSQQNIMVPWDVYGVLPLSLNLLQNDTRQPENGFQSWK